MSEEGEEEIHWGRIRVTFAVGASIVAMPFILKWSGVDQVSTYIGIGSSTLTNVGTAVLLAGVLFVLERGFLKRVRSAAAKGAEEGTQKVTEDLVARVDSLQKRVDQRTDEGLAERISKATAVSKTATFRTVCDAFEGAQDDGALGGDGGLTVPGSKRFNGPRFAFWWGELGARGDAASDDAPALLVTYVVDQPQSGGTPVVEAEWREGASAEDFAVVLAESMTSRGFQAERTEVDFGYLFKTLGGAIRDAILARARSENAWFLGQLHELIADGWAVTSEGLEVRGHGIVVPSADWPTQSLQDAHEPAPIDFQPAAPEWAGDKDWAFAVNRASLVHTTYNYPTIRSLPQPKAYNSQTSPHR